MVIFHSYVTVYQGVVVVFEGVKPWNHEIGHIRILVILTDQDSNYSDNELITRVNQDESWWVGLGAILDDMGCFFGRAWRRVSQVSKGATEQRPRVDIVGPTVWMGFLSGGDYRVKRNFSSNVLVWISLDSAGTSGIDFHTNQA